MWVPFFCVLSKEWRHIDFFFWGPKWGILVVEQRVSAASLQSERQVLFLKKNIGPGLLLYVKMFPHPAFAVMLSLTTELL